MLPPGHLAGGYLAGKIAAVFIPQINQLEYLALSALFGFAPDLDWFLLFIKNKNWLSTGEINHRVYWTHAPLLYLAIFGAWYFLAPTTRLIAWTFILGTESHLLIDTLDIYGIRWLWPFSPKVFGIKLDEKFTVTDTNTRFFSHWIEYFKKYIRTISFKLEFVLIILALATLILNLKSLI